MLRFLFPAILLLLVGCKTIEPVAPAPQVQVAPRAEQRKSTIVLPLSINLQPYFQLADKQVPFQFDGSEDRCEGVAFTYHFDRDPLQLNASDNRINIGVTGKYWIKMSYCPGCTDLLTEKPICLTPRVPFSCGINEPMRKMRLEYTTEYELTENYGITTKTKLAQLKAIDPCEVTVFHFDATEQLLAEVRKSLEKLATDIDAQAAKLSFKEPADDLWHKAQDSYAINGYGHVQLRPQSIAITRPKIVNNVLKASLVVEAFPFFSSGKKTSTRTPVPTLKFIDKPVNDTLELVTDFQLKYDSLSMIINDLASGTKLLIQEKEVIIDSIHITGAENQFLIFRVQFSGKKRGTLFLKGQPYFDAATQQIELKQVDFDLETKSLLLKSAKWLFSDRILRELERASKQDLKPQLQQLQKALNKSIKFTQDGFALTGLITSLSVEDVYPETEQLNIRILARGNLQLSTVGN